MGAGTEAQVTGPLRGLVWTICLALCLVVQQQGQSRDTQGGPRKEAASGDPDGNRQTQGAGDGNGELWASQEVTHTDGLEVLVTREEGCHR